jgi:hypothetical protein
MPYALDFASDLFCDPDEGDDAGPASAADQPASIFAALWYKREHDPDWWANMVYDCVVPLEQRTHQGYYSAQRLPCHDEIIGAVGIQDVIDRIDAVNLCGSLNSPVDVWIDEEGWYTVDVVR